MYLELLIWYNVNNMPLSNNASSADNQQEMLKSNYYFSGLMAGEMSCSIIKRENHNPRGHYYYAVDLTVSNSDKKLLSECNKIVMNGRGLITPVKGAYNLSARGKEKVRMALDFLERHPIPIGDLVRNRIIILKSALAYLDAHKGARFQKEKTIEMEKLRKKLREIKEKGIVDHSSDLRLANSESLGHFFAGVIDGEGSFGTKSSGLYKQPFFAIAMKDKKIIESLQKFLAHGTVRLRKDGVYHLEINRRDILKDISNKFLDRYPLRHERQRNRLQILQQLLNDYTPKSLNLQFQRT